MTSLEYEERKDMVVLALADAIQIVNDSDTKSTSSLITAVFEKLLDDSVCFE